MLRSAANGVTGRWTSPGWKAGMNPMSREKSPAVRLAVEDAELFELGADMGLAFRARGRQWRPGGADRAAHDHHAALERGRILVAEQRPQPRHFVLQLARARPVAGHAGVEQIAAEIGADRARGRIG